MAEAVELLARARGRLTRALFAAPLSSAAALASSSSSPSLASLSSSAPADAAAGGSAAAVASLASGGGGGKGRQAKRKTVAGQFKGDLASLMAVIRATRPHYVRCLKPNDAAVPGVLDRRRLVEQLRCGRLCAGAAGRGGVRLSRPR